MPSRAISAGAQAGDVAPVVGDRAAGRLQELGQQVEAGGLAGAVRPDQRVDRALLDLQRHVVDGDEALELLGEAHRLQSHVHADATSPLRRFGIKPHLRDRFNRLRCPQARSCSTTETVLPTRARSRADKNTPRFELERATQRKPGGSGGEAASPGGGRRIRRRARVRWRGKRRQVPQAPGDADKKARHDGRHMTLQDRLRHTAPAEFLHRPRIAMNAKAPRIAPGLAKKGQSPKGVPFASAPRTKTRGVPISRKAAQAGEHRQRPSRDRNAPRPRRPPCPTTTATAANAGAQTASTKAGWRPVSGPINPAETCGEKM